MKPTAVTLVLLAWAAHFFSAGHVRAGQIDIAGPAGSEQFGYQVTILPNGNFVVTDPSFDVPGPVNDIGPWQSVLSGARLTLTSGAAAVPSRFRL